MPRSSPTALRDWRGMRAVRLTQAQGPPTRLRRPGARVALGHPTPSSKPSRTTTTPTTKLRPRSGTGGWRRRSARRFACGGRRTCGASATRRWIRKRKGRGQKLPGRGGNSPLRTTRRLRGPRPAPRPLVAAGAPRARRFAAEPREPARGAAGAEAAFAYDDDSRRGETIQSAGAAVVVDCASGVPPRRSAEKGQGRLLLVHIDGIRSVC